VRWTTHARENPSTIGKRFFPHRAAHNMERGGKVEGGGKNYRKEKRRDKEEKKANQKKKGVLSRANEDISLGSAGRE